jgi:hypothetical protein
MSPQLVRSCLFAVCVLAAPGCAQVRHEPQSAAPPRIDEASTLVPPVEAMADAAPVERVVRFAWNEGGWKLSDVLEHINRVTNWSVLYESGSGTRRQRRLLSDATGDVEIRESDLGAWLRAGVADSGYLLVEIPSVRTRDGRRELFLIDVSDPLIRSKSALLPESEVLAKANREDVYVVTTLTLERITDPTALRNALAPLSTQTAGIGRIQDVPGSAALIVGDYAPVVAAMKRIVDLLNDEPN